MAFMSERVELACFTAHRSVGRNRPVNTKKLHYLQEGKKFSSSDAPQHSVLNGGEQRIIAFFFCLSAV